MLISPQTRISVILNANPKALDAIASINPHFGKLRNPILRKILASRVTIADAARIGNASVAMFFEKLEPLGFVSENGIASLEKTGLPVQPEKKEKPANLPAQIVELDVREALATGNDPFNEIMDAMKNLQPNQVLKLINTFEPTPLIDILNKRGYQHFAEEISPELVYTYFYQTVGNSEEKIADKAKPEAKNSFPEIRQKYQGRLREIDVRNLEMPLPMTTILETLEALQPDEALFVIHKRVPRFLLPQLNERGFDYVHHDVDPGRLDLIIYPKQNGNAH